VQFWRNTASRRRWLGGKNTPIESPVPSQSLPAKSPPRPEWVRRIALVAVSLVFGLLSIELGLRAVSGFLFWWPNFVVFARTSLTGFHADAYVRDERLGYVPRPGFATENGYDAPEIHIDAQGFRVTGDAPTTAGAAPILALGDSYTYGAEVADRATWPAHLQRLTGRPVLNAGVAGYGFDQIVLRAGVLASSVHPSAIVVDFIADDLRRMEASRLWSADKPYFDIDNGQLVLRNVPLPPPTDPRRTLSPVQQVLGYSFLVDFIIRRLDLLENWFGDHIRVHPAGTGEKIACLLTGDLLDIQRKSAVPLLLVAQYDPFVWKTDAFAAEQRRATKAVLDCARQRGLKVLDTFDALAAAKTPGGPQGLYGQWHMNDAGNDVIAGLIAAALDQTAH
jgi:lysophospholipase L1-like esterase